MLFNEKLNQLHRWVHLQPALNLWHLMLLLALVRKGAHSSRCKVCFLWSFYDTLVECVLRYCSGCVICHFEFCLIWVLSFAGLILVQVYCSGERCICRTAAMCHFTVDPHRYRWKLENGVMLFQLFEVAHSSTLVMKSMAVIVALPFCP